MKALIAAVAAGILVFAGCAQDNLLPPVKAWLACDECVDGERNTVRGLGQVAVAQLANALLRGPTAEEKEVVRQQAAWDYSQSHGGSSPQFEAEAVSNFVAVYQERSAVALGDIRTSGAKAALDEALQPANRSRYRPSVLRAIRAARARIDATPFHGTLARRSVNFGDTAVLLPGPSPLFVAGDVAYMDDSVFPATDLTLSRAPGRMGIAAVGAGGSHMVLLRRASPPRTEYAFLTISSVEDANDRAMRGCTSVACEDSTSPIVPAAALPFQAFGSLWSLAPHRDSSDMFRFQPAAPLAITARVSWNDSANVDLEWRSCGQLSAVGNLAGATQAKPEVSSVTVPGGSCWLLLVLQKTRMTAPTLTHLKVTSP